MSDGTKRQGKELGTASSKPNVYKLRKTELNRVRKLKMALRRSPNCTNSRRKLKETLKKLKTLKLEENPKNQHLEEPLPADS